MTDRGLLCWAVLGERGARPAEFSNHTAKLPAALRAICRSAALVARRDAHGT
jgi:cytochrome b